MEIDQFRYIKIQPKTMDLSARLWGINTEFVGFFPQSLVLRSIVFHRLNFNISKLVYCNKIN